MHKKEGHIRKQKAQENVATEGMKKVRREKGERRREFLDKITRFFCH